MLLGGLGSAVSSPSGVWGGAPTDKRFGAHWSQKVQLWWQQFLLCKSTELKRCSMIEMRWNKYVRTPTLAAETAQERSPTVTRGDGGTCSSSVEAERSRRRRQSAQSACNVRRRLRGSLRVVHGSILCDPTRPNPILTVIGWHYHFITPSDPFPVPVRSAIKSNLTAWCNQSHLTVL